MQIKALVAIAIAVFSGCSSNQNFTDSISSVVSLNKEAMSSSSLEPYGFDIEKYYNKIKDIDVSECPDDFKEGWFEMVESSKQLAVYMPQYDKHILSAADDYENPVINESGSGYLEGMKKIIESVVKHNAEPL